MQIRLAKEEDIEGILPLLSQIYRVKNLPQNASLTLQEQISSSTSDVFVAQDDNKIIGAGTIFYLKNGGHENPFAYLEGIVVDDEFRGKGIGTALSKFAIDLARKKNCYKIIFTSGPDREKIHKFYENLGFKKWGFGFRMDLD
jgi:GNAT superfamily N-acetyltransferase